MPLGRVFGELAKAFAGTFSERLDHLPIKRYHYALVVINAHDGDLSQTTLGHEMYLDKASVVRMLDYLESEGCIVRKQNPTDRRAHLLELTPKALDMIPEIIKAVKDTNKMCLEKAREAGIEDFNEVLNQMRECLVPEVDSAYHIHFTHREDEKH